MSSRARAASVEFRARAPFVRSMTSSKTIRQERIFSECANEVAAVLKCLVLGEEGNYGGLEEREKFGLWRPYRILSPAWPYSSTAMKSTIFDSDCICLTILPTSSFGSLVSESRTR